MSYLFQINGKAVFPNPETLLIYPFKDIWDRDKSDNKEHAVKEFSYIEFMISVLKSNPYREYPDKSREETIRRDLSIEIEWKPDELIKDAINYIHEKQKDGSMAYTYWLSNKSVIEKVIEFFNNVDMDERNLKSGMPIYKPKDITSAVADAEKALTTLNALKTKVEEELYESSKQRSDKVISVFANPSSLK